MSAIYEFTANSLLGDEVPLRRFEGQVLLIVNTASKCGFTPQYRGLEDLYRDFSPRGFSVLGFPCNQFGGQEPGKASEIQEFCSTQYDVTFPLFEKIDVNGEDRNPVYDELTKTADAEGYTGDIRWNFEKFLLDGEGNIVARFSPRTEPDDPQVVEAIKSLL
jgi:glutathione peroxidase